MLATQRMSPPNPLFTANHAGAPLPLVPRRLSRESSAASPVPIRVLVHQSSPPLACDDDNSDSSSDSNAPPTISLRPKQPERRTPLPYSPGVSLRLTTARTLSASHNLSTSTSTSSLLPTSQSQPRLVRKKSGQLVKSSLKSSKSLSLLTPRTPYTNSKSEPATPTHTKAVHFDAQLEHVKLFLAEQKPLAVSRDGSPTEDTASGTDTDFPEWIYGSGSPGPSSSSPSPPPHLPHVVTMRTVNMPPVRPLTTPAAPVVLESLTLVPPSAPPTPAHAAPAYAVQGRVRVANLAFAKSVAARFTFDAWQTTSEVSARYVSSPDPATDVFVFTVRLGDLVAGFGGSGGSGGGGRRYSGHGEEGPGKRMLLAVRYCVAGREAWDNNCGRDFLVEFGVEARAASAPIAVSRSTPALPALSWSTPNTPSPSPVQTDTEADETDEAEEEGEYYDLRATPNARAIASLRSTLEKVVPPAPAPASAPILPRHPPPQPISTSSSSPSSSSSSSSRSSSYVTFPTTPKRERWGPGSQSQTQTQWTPGALSPAPTPTRAHAHTRARSYPCPGTPRTFLHPHPPHPLHTHQVPGPAIHAQSQPGTWARNGNAPPRATARREWGRVSASAELRWSTPASASTSTSGPAPGPGQPRALGSPRDAVDGDTVTYHANDGRACGEVAGIQRRHRRGYFQIEGLPEPSSSSTMSMSAALGGKVLVRRTPPGSPVGVASGSVSGEEGDKSDEGEPEDGEGEDTPTPMPGRLFSFATATASASTSTPTPTPATSHAHTHGLGLLRPTTTTITPTTPSSTLPPNANILLTEEDISEVSTPSLSSPSTSPSPSPSPVESDILLTDTDGTETETEGEGEEGRVVEKKGRGGHGYYTEFLSRFCFFTGSGTGTSIDPSTGTGTGTGTSTGIPGLLGADSPSIPSSLLASPVSHSLSPIQLDLAAASVDAFEYSAHSRAHTHPYAHPHPHGHSRNALYRHGHGHGDYGYSNQVQVQTQKLFVVPPPSSPPPLLESESISSFLTPSTSTSTATATVMVPRTQSAEEIERPGLGQQAQARSTSFDGLFGVGHGERATTPTLTRRL
ncbi:hypothetical protein H0H92_011610 [Tricholoma furcatifolium]|nr:hypothetical protein H0H92_011610 [Tricholoma furcatifolium]